MIDDAATTQNNQDLFCRQCIFAFIVLAHRLIINKTNFQGFFCDALQHILYCSIIENS